MLQQGGIKFDTMASAVLYIPEVLEHVNQEVPDYGQSNLARVCFLLL